MHDNLDDFLPLRVTKINAEGKRSFDERDKQRLVEACLQPGVSIAGMALEAGVNANVLWRWVRKYKAARAGRDAAANDAENSPSAFVPVVEITDTGTVAVLQQPGKPEALPIPASHESVRISQRAPSSSRLVAQLPNGVSLELECMSEDAALLKAMIAALRGR